MFDIGGWEFMLIIILGIVIIGPKELPGALRNITLWIRKARGMAREFQSGIDDIVQEAEFEQIRRDVIDGADPTGSMADIKDEITQAMDPDDEIKQAFSIDDTEDWVSDHDEQNEPYEQYEHYEPDDDPDGEEHSIALPEAPESDGEAEVELEAELEAEIDSGVDAPPDDKKSGA